MFTPQEVSEKTFPKASFGSGGYNMAAVDEFLDALTEDYTALYQENAALKTKLKALAEKNEEYRATEDAMRSTLLTAQRMAAKLVQEAEAEKEELLRQGRQEVQRQQKELEGEIRLAQRRLDLAKEGLTSFAARYRDICLQQADFFDRLPDMPLDNAGADTQDMVQSIGSDILQAFSAPQDASASQSEPTPQSEIPQSEPTPQGEPASQDAPIPQSEPAPQGEPAPQREAEVSAPQVEDDDDIAIFSRDFKLNLDELKFGRNYDGESEAAEDHSGKNGKNGKGGKSGKHGKGKR